MAQQTINVGAAANDGTGTPLRTAFQYTNSNFTELYTATGPSGNNITVPGNATITGDLTVDTSTLKVDSTNNRVGVGTASPGNLLELFESAGTPFVSINRGSSQFLNVGIDSTGAFYNVSGLNTHRWLLNGGTTEAARIDSSGNLGLGVTPSAWNTIGPVLQIEQASLVSEASNQLYLTANAYFASGNWNYINNSQASQYYQSAGAHVWRSATASTGVVAFTQAMTLDASGNLLVGTTGGSYRGQFAVDAGADRDILTAQVISASNGLQVKWNHATTTLRIICTNLPTSSAGLAAGTLWIDGNTIKIA